MRKEFSARVKAAALKRCSDEKGFPRCEGAVLTVPCRVVMGPGNLFYDHDRADGLGGEPTLENLKVLCKLCHDEKTHKHDNPRMAKADRIRRKHYGAKRPKQKIPGRKFDGTPAPARWKNA